MPGIIYGMSISTIPAVGACVFEKEEGQSLAPPNLCVEDAEQLVAMLRARASADTKVYYTSQQVHDKLSRRFGVTL